MCTTVRVHFCVCVCVCVCVCASTRVSTSSCVSPSTCVCTTMCASKCVCALLCVCVLLCVYTTVCVCACPSCGKDLTRLSAFGKAGPPSTTKLWHPPSGPPAYWPPAPRSAAAASAPAPWHAPAQAHTQASQLQPGLASSAAGRHANDLHAGSALDALGFGSMGACAHAHTQAAQVHEQTGIMGTHTCAAQMLRLQRLSHTCSRPHQQTQPGLAGRALVCLCVFSVGEGGREGAAPIPYGTYPFCPSAACAQG